jgi:hypothetical protein
VQIYFEYPKYLILVAVAIAAATSFLLYYKDRLYKELDKWKKILMASLRFVFVLIILLLILNPIFKTSGILVQKPILVFVQDNSASILLNKDSTYYQNQYKTELNNLFDDLKNKFDLRYMQFDEAINTDSVLNYQGQLTNISSIFPEIISSYAGMNLGAVLIATDGIYNSGENPIYLDNINFPVYSIAMGDTISQKDLILKDIMHNHIAFLGNKFPVRLLVSAEKCSEKESEIIIRRDEKIVYQSNFELPENASQKQIDIELHADKIGAQQYSVELKKLKDEISYENNFADFIINIVDNRNKVLLLANSPHPDIGAIKYALKDNPDFELEIKYIYDFNESVKNYDLVILHQLPSSQFAATKVFAEIKQNSIPSLYIIGVNTSIQAFNSIETGMKIVSNSNNFDDASGILNSNFLAFDIGVDQSFFKYLSPLKVNFADYNFENEAKILLHQAINGIKTSKPLIVFIDNLNSKNGIICGEGIWKWRLDDFKHNSDHDSFNSFINKTVQYLLVKKIKDKLNLEFKQVYNENEPVIVNVAFYNETFDLVPNLDISLVLKNEENKEFYYSFLNFGNSYRLDMGRLEVGRYSFLVKTKFDNKNYEYSGQFLVKSINIESLITKANHQVLFQLAEKTNAKVFYPNEMREISKEIEANQNIGDIAYKNEKLHNFTDLYLLFFVILLFAALEWILRKFWGGY